MYSTAAMFLENQSKDSDRALQYFQKTHLNKKKCNCTSGMSADDLWNHRVTCDMHLHVLDLTHTLWHWLSHQVKNLRPCKRWHEFFRKLHTLKSWHSRTWCTHIAAHTKMRVLITCACDSPAPRHVAFQYERPLKTAIHDILCVAGLYMCVFTFASKSVHASYLEVPSPASHPCRHHFTKSIALLLVTHIYLAHSPSVTHCTLAKEKGHAHLLSVVQYAYTLTEEQEWEQDSQRDRDRRRQDRMKKRYSAE